MTIEPIREATAAEVELEVYELVDNAAEMARTGEPGALEAHATLSAAILISKRLAEINETLKGIEQSLDAIHADS